MRGKNCPSQLEVIFDIGQHAVVLNQEAKELEKQVAEQEELVDNTDIDDDMDDDDEQEAEEAWYKLEETTAGEIGNEMKIMIRDLQTKLAESVPGKEEEVMRKLKESHFIVDKEYIMLHSSSTEQLIVGVGPLNSVVSDEKYLERERERGRESSPVHSP